MSARFVMAVVVTGSPLTVTIEGASAVVAAEDFVGGLTTGDRVQAAFLGDRLTVLAKAGGNGPNPNLFANPFFQVNQRGAVSGTSLANGDYFLDRLKSGSPTNAVTWTGDDIAGRVLTIPVGKLIITLQERRNFPAGTYTMSWGGTSMAFLRKKGDPFPGYFASPVTVTLDGTGDVEVNIAEGTLSWLKIEAGSVATPVQRESVDVVIARCEPYYQKFTFPAGDRMFCAGLQPTTTTWRAVLPLPAQMRSAPTVTFNAMNWTDSTAYAGAATLGATYWYGASVGLGGTMPANGAGRWPGFIASASSASFVALESEL